MNSILLVLSTTRTPASAIDFAVERAKEERARLVALYVVERELANAVFDRFSDVGFMGDKPSMNLTEAVMKEYRQRAYEELGRVQVKAMEAAVAYEPITREGEYLSHVLNVINEYDVYQAIVVRKKLSVISKYFLRPPSEILLERAPCDVKIFEGE
ncbi:MAG: universal stress protein [Deltaproteobacteria bacterium]|nr:universal stress protein [Deltaproteobacteria bacterium]